MVWKDPDHFNTRIENPKNDYSRGSDSFFRKNKKIGSKLLKIPDEMPIGLIGVVLLALIVLFVLFIPRNQKAIIGEELASFEKRLVQLEETLAKYDGTQERIARLESQSEKKDRMETRVDRLEKVIASRMKDIEKRLDRIAQKKPAVVPKKTEKKSAANAAQKSAKTKYHTVKKGETLYSIARQYGLKETMLQQLNQLGANAIIRPGQKLILHP